MLPLIGSNLAVDPAGLGIVLASFLVGVGLFQVPAGLAAVRYGNRNVCLSGLAGMALACVGSGFARTWPELALFRFAAGVGAAFFFAPALSLIASYFPRGQQGPIIGLYNGGFSVGGAFGLFVGAYLGTALGWGPALAIGGVALLGTSLACFAALPPERVEGPGRSSAELWATGRRALGSRSIWALSLALTGFWAVVYDVAQYFVEFARTVHPGWGYGVAAALSAAVVVISFPTGPFGGWLAERGRDRRLLAAIFGSGVALAAFAIPYASLVEIAPLLLGLGALDGIVFAILYLIPAYLPETQGHGLALGVGIVNSIQVLVGSLLAATFGLLIGLYGFTWAWIFAGAVGLGLIPFLGLVAPSRATSGEGTLVTSARSD